VGSTQGGAAVTRHSETKYPGPGKQGKSEQGEKLSILIGGKKNQTVGGFLCLGATKKRGTATEKRAR